MSKYFLTYIIVLTIFLAIDAIWLGFIAKKFYFNNLGYILAERPNMLAAGLFYSLYVSLPGAFINLSKFLIYFLLRNKKKSKIYQLFFLGFFNSLLNKKSFYRAEID